MSPAPGTPPPPRRLRPGIVLSSTEETCVVVAEGQVREVAFALPFPRPRAERVAPGHLVAVAIAPDGSDVVVWRWFDAVVIDPSGSDIAVWEAHHGFVNARPRDPRHRHRPGARAYLSAGLPGAEWWIAGPVVDRAEQSQVELDEVVHFFSQRGLWDRLT